METTVTMIPDDNSNSGGLFTYLKSSSGNASLPKGPELPAEVENTQKKKRTRTAKANRI